MTTKQDGPATARTERTRAEESGADDPISDSFFLKPMIPLFLFGAGTRAVPVRKRANWRDAWVTLVEHALRDCGEHAPFNVLCMYAIKEAINGRMTPEPPELRAFISRLRHALRRSDLITCCSKDRGTWTFKAWLTHCASEHASTPHER